MFGLNPWIILGVVLAFVGSNAFTAYKTNQIATERVDAKWIKEYAALEAKKNAVIAEATQRYIDSEASNLAQTQDWEKTDNEREKYVQGLRIANGRLVAANGGLFDRNGRPTGKRSDDGVPAAPGAAGETVTTATGCRLSDGIAADILDLTARADAAAIDAKLGHEYAVEIEAFRAKHKAKIAP